MSPIVEVPQITVHKLCAYKFEKLVIEHILCAKPEDGPEEGLIRDAAAGVENPDVCTGRFYPDVDDDLTDEAMIESICASLREGGAPILILSTCHSSTDASQLAIHTLLSELVARKILPAGDYVIDYEP